MPGVFELLHFPIQRPSPKGAVWELPIRNTADNDFIDRIALGIAKVVSSGYEDVPYQVMRMCRSCAWRDIAIQLAIPPPTQRTTKRFLE